jgi:hypothetical protein
MNSGSEELTMEDRTPLNRAAGPQGCWLAAVEYPPGPKQTAVLGDRSSAPPEKEGVSSYSTSCLAV